MTQPQPPVKAVLIRDDPNWTYVWPGHRTTTRRLRVYRTAPGRVTAILTERGPGTSITNAAKVINRKLADEYPDDVVLQVEHFPLDAGCGMEHFDGFDPNRAQHPWWRLPLEETADLYDIHLDSRRR